VQKADSPWPAAALRQRHPNRWSDEIRNLALPQQVWLNPEKEKKQPELNQAAQVEATSILTNTKVRFACYLDGLLFIASDGIMPRIPARHPAGRRRFAPAF